MPATKVFAGMARSYTPKLLSFLTHIGIRDACGPLRQAHNQRLGYRLLIA